MPIRNLSIFEKILFFLSIYVVVELYINTIIDYSPQIKIITIVIDTIICGIFLFEFGRGLAKAENKFKYFKKNWIDLVSSIPFIGQLRIGRVANIFRVLRVIRAGKLIFSLINKNNPFNTLRGLVIINIFVIGIFTVSIHHLEKHINPALSTLEDSFWWTLLTSISIGYLQDIVPITTEGKVLSVILIIMGMILFGTLISTITDVFVGEEELVAEIKEVKMKVEKIEEKLNNIEQLLIQHNKEKL